MVQGIGDNCKGTGALSSKKFDIKRVEIALFVNFRDIAQRGKVFGDRVYPTAGQIFEISVLIHPLHIHRSVF